MNDYQYEAAEAAYVEIIERAEGIMCSDSVSVYGVDGGKFGIEVSFEDEVIFDKTLGNDDEILAFADDVKDSLDLLEARGLTREQPFLIAGMAKEWL